MLKRLWRYCNKIFKLDEALSRLKNQNFSKKNNEPFITAILLLAMLMRVRSFNALKLSFKNNPKTWRKLLDGVDPPSISTLARGIEKSDLHGLSQINKKNNHRLHRNKVFNVNKASYGWMVAAIDGHEVFCSERRCCDRCCTRKKTIKVKEDGIEVEKEVTEYYHKYVVCQIILCSVPAIIDLEPVMPGEGELTAAKRMIKRILQEQSSRVEVFCFDALYLDSGLLNMLEQKNKYWITVLKQENRDAYKEIDRLLPSTKPIKMELDRRRVTLWDMHELVAWDNLDKPFRAVISDEKQYQWRINPITRKKEKAVIVSQWRWLTNMPSECSAKMIYHFGHARWNIENRGFHDLATNCRFDHPFHHHPTALLAMMWIIVIAFNLFYTFFKKNLKPQLRAKIQTRMQLAELIRERFILIDESIYPYHGLAPP